MIVTLAAVEMGSIFHGTLPELTAVGSGSAFWNMTSTSIIEIWMLSSLVVIVTVLVRSTVIARLRGDFIDILTNPRKRFLIPMGLHVMIFALPDMLPDAMKANLPVWFMAKHYYIAAWVLLLGWIALELPFYLMYKRLRMEHQ